MAKSFGSPTVLQKSPQCFICGEKFEVAFFERDVLMYHLAEVHPTKYIHGKRGHRKAAEARAAAEGTLPMDAKMMTEQKEIRKGTTKKDGDQHWVKKQPVKEKKQAIKAKETGNVAAAVEVRMKPAGTYKTRSDRQKRYAGHCDRQEAAIVDAAELLQEAKSSNAATKNRDADRNTSDSRLRSLCRCLISSCCLAHQTDVVDES